MHENVKLNKNKEEKKTSIHKTKQNNRSKCSTSSPPPPLWRKQGKQSVNVISSPFLMKETGKKGK
jgi:hypothetical protein